MLKLEAIDAYEVVEAEFNQVRGDIGVRSLFDGCRWAEGPVYLPAGRFLLWSDIPNDRILKWDETTGGVSVFREPAGFTNGHALDAYGRLVSCEQGLRRITRTEADGTRTVVAETFQGKRLNSPNDLVHDTAGRLWFTDAAYGIDSDYEGIRADSDLGACHVYRLDPGEDEPRMVASDFQRPTGITLSLDESTLFVVDSRANHLRRFQVTADGSLTGGEVIVENDIGSLDSMTVDEQDRIWVAAGDGVHCYDASGRLLGKIRTPEMASNVEFGGPRRNQLFITASTSLYSIMLATRGGRRVYAA